MTVNPCEQLFIRNRQHTTAVTKYVRATTLSHDELYGSWDEIVRYLTVVWYETEVPASPRYQDYKEQNA